MQLSLHADYALRALIYLGSHPGEVVTTERISAAYGVSRNHMVRVLHTLREHGYVKLYPGRSGGVQLAMEAGAIRLGEVVLRAEASLRLVECFDKETNTCPIARVCQLQPFLREALHAFLQELNTHTLADLVAGDRGQKLAEALVEVERYSPPR